MPFSSSESRSAANLASRMRLSGEASPPLRHLRTADTLTAAISAANWMEMDLPLVAGYYIRPLDLYLSGQDVALLDIAEHRRPVEHILDDIRPGWRETRSRFEVFKDTDGFRSIRTRSE
jgi:hypothetical protein